MQLYTFVFQFLALKKPSVVNFRAARNIFKAFQILSKY